MAAAVEEGGESVIGVSAASSAVIEISVSAAKTRKYRSLSLVAYGGSSCVK
jgi:hypothetical protein